MTGPEIMVCTVLGGALFLLLVWCIVQMNNNINIEQVRYEKKMKHLEMLRKERMAEYWRRHQELDYLEDSLEEFNAAVNRALARATGKNPNIDSIW